MPGLEPFSFLIPGNFAEDDPARGLYQTIDLIRLGERLGYGCAWVRHRHLERGISSAPVFLAAVAQHTDRIGLGTAVIQLGYETPFRLAEDLAMADVLSGGRVQVGVSTGRPPFEALLGDLLREPGGEPDYGHGRVERLIRALESRPLADDTLAGNAAGAQVPRLQPVAQGLARRVWYGGGSLASADWAGHTSVGFLTGNIVTGESSDDFLTVQARLIATHRSAWADAGAPRVEVGRVVLPTDSADRTTRARYAAFKAGRDGRTRAPHGPRRTLFLPDLVGSSDDILAALATDPVVAGVSGLRLELPYEFGPGDYAQILTDFAERIAPRLPLGALTPSS